MGDADLPGLAAPAGGGVAGVHDDLAHLGRDFHPGKGVGEGLLVHRGVVENPGAEDLVVQRFDGKALAYFFHPVSGEEMVTSKRNTPGAVRVARTWRTSAWTR